MKNTLAFFVLTFLIFGCGNNEKENDKLSSLINEKEINRDLLVSISDFKMDAKILNDGDEIEVLCASESLFPSDEVDFYVHAIVVSQISGDTINVLATSYLKVPDDRMTQYHSPMTDAALVFQNLDNIDGTNVKDLEPQKHKLVFVDPEYIQLDYTVYPSTIGMIGEFEISDLE